MTEEQKPPAGTYSEQIYNLIKQSPGTYTRRQLVEMVGCSRYLVNDVIRDYGLERAVAPKPTFNRLISNLVVSKPYQLTVEEIAEKIGCSVLHARRACREQDLSHLVRKDGQEAVAINDGVNVKNLATIAWK